MRVLFDTNLVISGLLWSGTPQQVLHLAATKRVVAVTSEALVDELRDVLKREKLHRFLTRRGQTSEDHVAVYLSYTSIVEPAADVEAESVRDPEDVKVIAAAVGGRVEYLVTGDEDLLTLQRFEDVLIVSPANFFGIVADADER